MLNLEDNIHRRLDFVPQQPTPITTKQVFSVVDVALKRNRKRKRITWPTSGTQELPDRRDSLRFADQLLRRV
jgi:hypothetical protein